MKPYIWVVLVIVGMVGIAAYNSQQQDIGRNEAIVECNESEKQVLLDIIADLDYQIEIKEAFEQRARMLIEKLVSEKEAMRVQHESDIDIFRQTQTNECGVMLHGHAVNRLLSGAHVNID